MGSPIIARVHLASVAVRVRRIRPGISTWLAIVVVFIVHCREPLTSSSFNFENSPLARFPSDVSKNSTNLIVASIIYNDGDEGENMKMKMIFEDRSQSIVQQRFEFFPM